VGDLGISSVNISNSRLKVSRHARDAALLHSGKVVATNQQMGWGARRRGPVGFTLTCARILLFPGGLLYACTLLRIARERERKKKGKNKEGKQATNNTRCSTCCSKWRTHVVAIVYMRQNKLATRKTKSFE
jgi:hypothetical protein